VARKSEPTVGLAVACGREAGRWWQQSVG